MLERREERPSRLEVQTRDVARAHELVDSLTTSTFDPAELAQHYTKFFKKLFQKKTNDRLESFPYTYVPISVEQLPQAQELLQEIFNEVLQPYTPQTYRPSTVDNPLFTPKMIITAILRFGLICKPYTDDEIQKQEKFQASQAYGVNGHLRNDDYINRYREAGFIVPNRKI